MRHLLLPPDDTDAPTRLRRLKELGIENRPVPEFDDFARVLATRAGGQYAMVNIFDETHQYFAGYYEAGPEIAPGQEPDEAAGSEEPGEPDEAEASDASSSGEMREMERDHGYCVHVAARRRALVLDDVRDYPRFAGNPVVDEIGIHAYLGAPLIDSTGTLLGTVCVVDTEPQQWGREGLDLIKSMATDLVKRIESGAGAAASGDGPADEDPSAGPDDAEPPKAAAP